MILGTGPWNGDGNVRAGSQAGNGWNSGGWEWRFGEDGG
jgi:hypothetical protein